MLPHPLVHSIRSGIAKVSGAGMGSSSRSWSHFLRLRRRLAPTEPPHWDPPAGLGFSTLPTSQREQFGPIPQEKHPKNPEQGDREHQGTACKVLPKGTKKAKFLFSPMQQQQPWLDSIIAIFLPRDMPRELGRQVPRLHEHIYHQWHERGRCPVSHSFYLSPEPPAAKSNPKLGMLRGQTPRPPTSISAPRPGAAPPRGVFHCIYTKPNRRD